MASFETINKKSDDTKKIRVGMGSDGSIEIRSIDKKTRGKKPRINVGLVDKGVEIKTKDPEIVLKNAEECFKNGDFENAFIKLGFVDNEYIEERTKELLDGSEEEKKLALEMYQKDEWIEEAKKEWRDSNFVQEINKRKKVEENKK
ncbi:hypothetical protein KAS31_04835 [Candidatus Parcubacteria bacterium]|nr:hypothetical protein [Candidatus Parcubacteria bacterium]MCK5157644.1 hypothetical protein [Candidatus Heimdallarchaeota archaeon]